MFKSIVVAIDGSDHAQNALGVACDLAKQSDAKVHLVHAPELSSTGLAVGSGAVEIPPTDAAVQDAGRAVMENAVAFAKTAGVEPVSTQILEGSPAEQTVRAAEKLGADLIVTGRRGVGGIHSLLLGSTSGRIAQTAPCAHLTVK